MSKSVIIDKTLRVTKSIKNANFFLSRISHKAGTVKINQTLPFRVKFMNVGVRGYGPSNPAPIGIAVIGYNNYIL